MTYVEGFITPVPLANKDKYIAQARRAAEMIKRNGASRFVECWGDDVPRGKLNDLYMSVEAQPDEAVLFSWFEYPDKATRDAANKKMMADPAMADMMKDMPFDASRMIFGGFATIHASGRGGEMGYIDGVVAPVEIARRSDYLAFCRTVDEAFIEHGATRVVDTLADDVPDGKKTDFNRAVRRKDGETVAFGWIEWPSKQVRDAAWAKLRTDARLTGTSGNRGMDGKRMMFGGFQTLLNL